MAVAASAEPADFEEASDWFASKFPVTPEIAEALGAYAGSRAWTIAGVTQLDIVLTVHESLLKAIREGTPLKEWQESIGDTLTEAWGKRDSARLETIFRNATQSAYNAGRWRQINDPVMKQLRPFGLFDGIDDSRQSEICNHRDGTILPLDDPWWQSNNPPLHHRCRSRITTLRRAEAERRGVTVDPPSSGDVSDGFGRPPTDSEWSPKPGDYPADLFGEYQSKRQQIADKAKRPKIKLSE